MNADDQKKIDAAHATLDGIAERIAPHATLGEAMTTSGYPASQVEGARLLDIAKSFADLVQVIRDFLPARTAPADPAANGEQQPAA